MQVHDVIVVGCDGSEAARTAVDWAVERAGRLAADLVLAYGIPEYWLPPAASVLPGIVNASTNMLEVEADRVRARLPRSSVHAVALLGEPAAVLGQLSEQADLVVVGIDKHADVHGEGFGVVDLQVATISACNVAVIPHHRLGKPTGGVVVGVGGSAESNRALDIAACEAAALSHPLTILYATAPPKPWLLDIGPRKHRGSESTPISARSSRRLQVKSEGRTPAWKSAPSSTGNTSLLLPWFARPPTPICWSWEARAGAH